MHYIKLTPAALTKLHEISSQIWQICAEEDGSFYDLNLATELLKQIVFQIDNILIYVESND